MEGVDYGIGLCDDSVCTRPTYAYTGQRLTPTRERPTNEESQKISTTRRCETTYTLKSRQNKRPRFAEAGKFTPPTNQEACNENGPL